MTVNEIFGFLNSLYPTETACDFDNVGLLVGNGENEVTSALVSLDCTFDAINEAKQIGANLIITHHPVIFEPLKSVTKGDIVFELIRNDISVISMHTNLDQCDGGVNDCLATAIGLSDIVPVTAADGFVLRKGTIPLTTAEKFAEQIKAALGGVVKYVGDKTISTVLVCSGSGGEFLETAAQNKVDALVTADVKHHIFLEAQRLGIALFDAGHYNTEDIIVKRLCEQLRAKFEDVEFIAYNKSNIKFI